MSRVTSLLGVLHNAAIYRKDVQKEQGCGANITPPHPDLGDALQL